jgi:hypothetical protein
MALNYSSQIISGLSSDTKPTNVPYGMIFFETDTRSAFRFTSSGWVGGVHHSTPATYISGTGTAGADNTAQTVVSSTVAAHTLNEVGDRLRVRAYWSGDTGAAITGSVKLGPTGSEVLISHTTDSGAATLQVNEAWLHYIDNTHANIIENEAGGVGALSAPNVAGFTWASDQTMLIAQDAANNNHIVVYGAAWVGGLLSMGGTGVGYGAGAGGTVTQLTSKATTVVLNKLSGTVTTHNAALAAGAIVSFTVTNSTMTATDVVVVNHSSGGTIGAYTVMPNTPSAGSFRLTLRNNTAGSLGEALVLRFTIIRGSVT